MSSPPPYQSRLFNFLNRQYININDQVDQKMRQLKLGIKWSLQTVLYPVYLLVQTARMIRKRLQSDLRKNQLELKQLQNQYISSLPDSDQQINTILKEISQQNFIPSLAQINLQGIASTIKNSHLVFVDSHNLICDVLSPTQQKQLKLLIRDIRADYWEKKRIALLKEPKIIKHSPLINKTGQGGIFPFDLFWQLMMWIQKSPVAISLNIFDESQYISISSPQDQIPTKNQNYQNISHPKFLTNIDHRLASLEQLYFFKNKDSVVNSSNSTNNSELDSANNNFLNQNQNQNFSIQVLIKLAIEYFFGDPQNQTKLTGDNSEACASSNHNDQEKELSKTQSLNSFFVLNPKLKKIIKLWQQQIIIKLNALFSNKKNTSLVHKKSPNNSKIISRNFKNKPDNSDNLTSKISNNIKNNLQQVLPNVNNLTHNLTTKINNSSAKLTINNKFKKPKDPFEIQALIWAAIDYFFNKKNNFLSSTSPKLNSNNLSQANRHKLLVEENWLSWDDLYSQNLTNDLANDLTELAEKEQLELNSEVENLANQSPNKSFISPSLISNKNQVSSFTNEVNLEKYLANKNNENLNNNQNITVNSIATNSLKNHQERENHSPSLDTKAVNLGYEKHFLQTILEWIDKIILWIEELFIKIWRWFKRQ